MHCPHVVIDRHLAICQAVYIEIVLVAVNSALKMFLWLRILTTAQSVSVLEILYCSAEHSTKSDVKIPLNVANRNTHIYISTHFYVGK